MSHAPTLPLPLPQRFVTSAQVQTLREQFLALQADYHHLRVCFGHLGRFNTFTEPDWFDMDAEAFNLHGNLQAREQVDIPVKDNQKSQYQQLRSSFRQIKDQLVAFRDRLEGPEPYNYPQHVGFQVLGPGNQIVHAPQQTCDFAIGRQRFARNVNPQTRGAETAITNTIMSGVLPRGMAPPDFEDLTVYGSEDATARQQYPARRTSSRLLQSDNSSEKWPSAYEPEFSGLVNFPATNRHFSLERFTLTGMVRKPRNIAPGAAK